MNSVLYGQLQQRLTGVEEGTANLVLAACHGADGLEKLLAGGSIEEARKSETATSQPAGAFLKSITAKGFRGIGPELTIRNSNKDELSDWLQGVRRVLDCLRI